MNTEEKIQQMSPPYEKAILCGASQPCAPEIWMFRDEEKYFKIKTHKQRQFLIQPIWMAPPFCVSVKLSDDVDAADTGSTF